MCLQHRHQIQAGTPPVANFPTASFPWGDRCRTGAEVTDADIFRLLSHNVNGLSMSRDQSELRNFAETLDDKSVSLFGLQETNRNFGNRHVLESFHQAIKSVSTHHHGAVSSARLDWDHDYQPGGTAISVRNKWATRFLSKGSDDFGRWSWITLVGKGTTKITFITGYRVCDGANEAPITARTVRAQQEWMYADRGFETINLRDRFTSDLTSLAKAFQASGHDLVIMLDANESSGQGSAVDQMCYDCQLTDAHTLTSDLSDPPPTYHRGSRKIDFVLVSSRLTKCVAAATILSLHDGYLSDHRALIVDFHSELLFSSPTSAVVIPSSRQLTSTNPRAVHIYIKFMKKFIEKHRIIEKVNDLVQISESGQWSSKDVAQWEQIDKVLANARIMAENKCPRRKSGQLPWSPELMLAGKRLLYWKMRVRAIKSRHVNTRHLLELESLLNVSHEDILPLTCQSIWSKIRQAKRALTKVKKNAAELREDHLKNMAHLQADLHGMDVKAARNAIAAREKSSKQFRLLRNIFGIPQVSGLDRIDVPNSFAVLREGEAIPRIPLVVKEEIEEVLVPHTERRFKQHRETPFGQDNRWNLGIDCTSDTAQQISDGTYDAELESLSEEATAWLKELERKDFVKAGAVISTALSTEDVVTGWAKMRESTASAPGSHYGHYKTASVVARLPEEHPDHTLLLAELFAKMTSLPLKHGFAPIRWQYCIDAILEKIPGKPLIEKLRVIMLYEADFNFVLKLIWGRRLVRHAERFNALGTSNHGSRSGRQTKDAHMQKLLLYEYARLTRTSLITMDNDAKSCYDRIIKTLAMLACIGVGLPICAAMMHNKTHHGMQHQIKSRHGLFRPYSGSDHDTLEGTGQGSGASPAIWLIYSVTLLAAYAKFTEGMTVLSPYDEMRVRILAIFYVDDGMPGVSDSLQKDAEPLPSIIHKAATSLQVWERLLFGSGGALEFSKCFNYIVYWDLSGGEHRMLSPDEIHGCDLDGDTYMGPISLTYGADPRRHKIATELPWKGRRTLGIRLAPAGNWTEEYQFRRTQSRDLALRIAGASINSETAKLGYYAMICPKLEFPLGATQFTQRECDSISSPVLRACLSKIGYNRNMPREVVFGPTSLFGIGMHDYYIEQGIQQIATLVGHVRQNSETGHMLRIELQWCQAQAGTVTHLLADPSPAIDYIETCWIMSVRDFLRTYGLKIDLTSTKIPMDQCVGDEFIMDALRLRGGCTSTELIRLNACRMWLQVARVSDISCALGQVIREDVLHGKDSTVFLSNCIWPRQGRPPKLWWNLWRKKLKLVFSIDGFSPRLRQQLGKWTSSLNSAEWSTLASTTLQRTEVYTRRPDGQYTVFRAHAISRNKSHVTQTSDIIDRLPACTVPASLGPVCKNGTRRVYFRDRVAASCNDIPVHSNFMEYVASQDPHIVSILHSSDLTDETALQVSRLLCENTDLCSATDGGLLHDGGTFGFLWGSFMDNQVHGMGKGHVPGNKTSMSSTRSELCGIFASLTYLRLVTQYFHVVLPQGTQCTLYCDSKAALQRVKSLHYTGFGTTWRCRANYDIEAAIRECLEKQEVQINWSWVRGHASRRKRPQDFSWEEKLNESADALATLARDSERDSKDRHWPEQHVSVVGPQGRLCGRLSSEIRYCCTAPDLLTYWKERYKWTSAQVKSLDTLGTAAAVPKLRPAAARNIQKLRCGWLPVNNRESRSDPDRHAGCSACSTNNLVPETVDHVFQCANTERRRVILTQLSSFHSSFREMKTASALISAIQTGAVAWIKGEEIPSVDTLNLPDSRLGRLIKQAYTEQSDMGWNVLFRGFWSVSWRLAQEEEFKKLHCKEMQDTGERWAGRAQLWFFDLFEAAWTLRNEQEHGHDAESQRLARRTKCERAIRRLFLRGADLDNSEKHPFRDPIDVLLTKSTADLELWVTKTEAYLQKAFKRARARPQGQTLLTAFFAQLPM